MFEREYQAWLIKRLKKKFIGCEVLKNDSGYIQGIPDLTILYQDKWAMLEVKISEDSIVRPNQAYYIEKMNRMSFAAFIYPENQEEVLSALSEFLLGP